MITPRHIEVRKLVEDGHERANAEAASIFRQLRRPNAQPGTDDDFVNGGLASWAHAIAHARIARLAGDRQRAAYYLRYAAAGRRHAATCMLAVRCAADQGEPEQGSLL